MENFNQKWATPLAALLRKEQAAVAAVKRLLGKKIPAGKAAKRLYRFCESYEAVRFESVFFIQRLRALVGV